MRKYDSLEDYLLHMGPLLGARAAQTLDPLHVPGRDPVVEVELLRQPFPAQREAITAIVKALDRQNAVWFVGECGVGKTLCGMAAVHARHAGRPYRALVLCPPQLAQKWERELRETIPGVSVTQLATWQVAARLDRHGEPTGPEWYIVTRERAKLSYGWEPVALERKHMKEAGLRCPHCGGRLVDADGLLLQRSYLKRQRRVCEHVLGAGLEAAPGCGSPLWQAIPKPRRYAVADYIKRKLKGCFSDLVLDEIQDAKGEGTANGHAVGTLAGACDKVIALTGTLAGGLSEHLRPLLFRLAPASLVAEGFAWGAPMRFSEIYGRIETRVVERDEGEAEDNRQSRGTRKTTTKSLKPGIMPPLYGRHLLDKTVFLSLERVCARLPELEEKCIPVLLNARLKRAYQGVEQPLAAAIKEMVRKGNRKLLGPMLNCLLCYPDYPFAWNPIGYHEGGEGGGKGAFRTVVVPDSLPMEIVYPKEQALIDLVLQEKAAGRQCWVYVSYTDRHDVQSRLEGLLTAAGLKVGSLRAKVSPGKREEWIRRHGPKVDVMLSHPKLVETGLDLFAKDGSYNFATLVWFEPVYNPFTMRQASRRAWRIGQPQTCRVYYLYYGGTMQERAMQLMGRKLAASTALEGKFSTEGLIALSGEDGSIETALARSLEAKLDRRETARAWAKVSGQKRRRK